MTGNTNSRASWDSWIPFSTIISNTSIVLGVWSGFHIPVLVLVVVELSIIHGWLVECKKGHEKLWGLRGYGFMVLMMLFLGETGNGH
jgi:hypothetical protein